MQDASLPQEWLHFFQAWLHWLKYRFRLFFSFFESLKSHLATTLYRQRGRYVRPFIHSSMALLVVGGITLGPVLIEENLSQPWRQEEIESSGAVLSAQAGIQEETATLISAKPRAEVLEYEVRLGDTTSTIAEKFGISVDTIRWENDLKTVKSIKVGQTLKILPVSGVLYKVKRGETIHSIAKKHEVDAQGIVDWPYNIFSNDETFALAVGQSLIIPDGIKPKEVPVAPKRYYAQAPAAGTVTGTGQFAWPTNGYISQGFRWYHRAIDIANKAAPNIVAADSGQVVLTGWPSWAYGNQVVVDHGNGYTTVYAHLSQIYVQAGQKVSQGQALGKMGTTGRSTGVHLHFEIRKSGALQNPLTFLK